MKVIYRDIPTAPIEYASYAFFLTEGKIYDAEEAPLIYDPNGFVPISRYLIVCDDGHLRAFDKFVDWNSSNFTPVEELRDEKLKQIFE